jgi:hypothetical protein
MADSATLQCAHSTTAFRMYRLMSATKTLLRSSNKSYKRQCVPANGVWYAAKIVGLNVEGLSCIVAVLSGCECLLQLINESVFHCNR